MSNYYSEKKKAHKDGAIYVTKEKTKDGKRGLEFPDLILLLCCTVTDGEKNDGEKNR